MEVVTDPREKSDTSNDNSAPLVRLVSSEVSELHEDARRAMRIRIYVNFGYIN